MRSINIFLPEKNQLIVWFVHTPLFIISLEKSARRLVVGGDMNDVTYNEGVVLFLLQVLYTVHFRSLANIGHSLRKLVVKNQLLQLGRHGDE